MLIQLGITHLDRYIALIMLKLSPIAKMKVKLFNFVWEYSRGEGDKDLDSKVHGIAKRTKRLFPTHSGTIKTPQHFLPNMVSCIFFQRFKRFC